MTRRMLLIPPVPTVLTDDEARDISVGSLPQRVRDEITLQRHNENDTSAWGCREDRRARSRGLMADISAATKSSRWLQ